MSRLYVDGGKIDEESMEDVPNSELYSNEQQPLLAGDTVQKSGFGAGGPKEGCTSYKRQGANEIATFFNFAKASIGSGSFALPWGILQVGVLVGGLGMILLGLARLGQYTHPSIHWGLVVEGTLNCNIEHGIANQHVCTLVN
ncbi:hypothetical protein GBAR_LOCUS26545 [Geodia barretti]|uniref:Amino acid transporter transmembrane domain-containing protein n=1 Tax=Geodia barretti TaxID=519541 RepID=A0AA35TJ75_GEOBA|nr:hypothetical protein GBAR_LOCUS26545 [Geodia barretti]